MTLVFASFAVERGLSVIFESRPFLAKFGNEFNYKVTFAFVTSLIFVYIAEINIVKLMQVAPTAVDAIASASEPRYSCPIGNTVAYILSYVFTALVVAGGSKASLKIFRDVMLIQSNLSRNTRESSRRSADKVATDAVASANGDNVSKDTIFDMLDKNKHLLKPTK